MPAALRRGEFIVEYQPLVRIADRALIGVEALVRWRHPTLGLLQPDQFIELAEASGLIVPLGEWVLTEACRQAAGGASRPPGRAWWPASTCLCGRSTSRTSPVPSKGS